MLARVFLAAVWLGMGPGAKVLGLVQRHRELVARILGEAHADRLTVLIGFGEIAIALWVFSGRLPRTCALVQMGLVGVMNLIEFTLARDLLLFGGWNLLVAAAFMTFVAFVQWPRRPCSPD